MLGCATVTNERKAHREDYCLIGKLNTGYCSDGEESGVGRAGRPGKRRGDNKASLSTILADTDELVSGGEDLRLTHMKRWRCGCFRPILSSSRLHTSTNHNPVGERVLSLWRCWACYRRAKSSRRLPSRRKTFHKPCSREGIR